MATDLTQGQVAMPVRLGDPGMKPHVLDLYAYLKARSDGTIGRASQNDGRMSVLTVSGRGSSASET